MDTVIGFPLWLRWKLYSAGVYESKKLPHPVISVGSVLLGGSGKTPMVELLAKELSKCGQKPAILTRGYGRKNKNERIVLLDGKCDWELCGDEPLMLSRKLPGVPIIVHPNRYESANLVADKVDCYILDDGFQRLQISRNLDILMFAGNEFETGLFPFGERRDGLWRIHRLNKSNAAIAFVPIDGDIDSFRKKLPKDLNTYRYRVIVEGLHSLSDWQNILPPTTIAGKRVFLSAGIARPERFFNIAKSIGTNAVGEMFFRDHYFFSQSQVESVQEKAKNAGAELILTTEKDAVRIEKFGGDNIFALSIKIEIVDALELCFWGSLI